VRIIVAEHGFQLRISHKMGTKKQVASGDSKNYDYMV